MYIDFTLALMQTALVTLKILGLFDRSWWLVMVPSIIWTVINILCAAKGRKEDDEE